MPVNTHLEFSEISDFTPGYFSVGEWLMPANGSQEMVDCQPTAGGGIRASVKPTTFSTTGLPSTGKVCGIYAANRQGESAGVGAAACDRYIAVWDTSDSRTKIYRWNECTTTVATTWTLIEAHNIGAIPNQVQFDTFVDSNLKNHVVWNLAAIAPDTATPTVNNGDGLWSLQFSYQAGQGASATDEFGGAPATYSVTRRKAGFTTAVAVQDDRLIAAIGTRFSTLNWSASQDLTSFPGANTLTVQASRQGSLIVSITPYAPGDLLCATNYASWTMIQGALATTTSVRTMSDEKTMGYGQRAIQTPAGLAFVSNEVGVTATSQGDQFTVLSTQIDAGLWTGVNGTNGAVGGGGITFGANYLLAPHGLFYDFRTKGWFRSSVLLDTVKGHYHSHYEGQNRNFFVATGNTSFNLWQFDMSEIAQRNESYTWKSAPMRRDQRNIRIREVQVVLKSYHVNSTATITVGSTSYAVTPGVTGRQTIRFLLDEWAEMLDVQIVSASNQAGTEAPSIEAVRVGSMDDHQTIRFV